MAKKEPFFFTALPLKRITTWKTYLARALPLFPFIAIFFLILALFPLSITLTQEENFTTPHLNENPTIYFLIDRSSSMDTIFDFDTLETKFQTAQKWIEKESKKHPEALFSLSTFARDPQILVPPTADHTFFKLRLSLLSTVKDQEKDGSSLGYALKELGGLAAQASKEEAPSLPALIILTDGVSQIRPDDKEHPLRSLSVFDAAKELKGRVRLFFIHFVEEKEKIKISSYQNILKQTAHGSKGGYAEVLSVKDFNSFFPATLESTLFIPEDTAPSFLLSPFFLFLSMVSLTLFALFFYLTRPTP